VSATLLDELLEVGEVGAVHTGAVHTGAVRTGAAHAGGEQAAIDEAALAALPELTGYELPRGGMDLKDHLSAIEIGLIRRALVEADGTVAEAARLLRMRRTTLVEKLRKYRLSA
jgi:sigma-54 specific flagellar transcriptional regulator A